MGYWNALAVGQFRGKVSYRALDALYEMALLCYDDPRRGYPARVYDGGQLALARRIGILPWDATPGQEKTARNRMSELFRELREAKAIEQLRHHAPGSTARWRLLLDVPDKGHRHRSTVP